VSGGFTAAGHQCRYFFADDGGEGDAHATHADGTECVFVDGPDDGHFFAAHSHDPAPAVFDGIEAAGKDGFGEEPFEFVLYLFGGRHIGSGLFFEGHVARSAEEDAVAEIPEVIKSFVKVKAAFKW